MQLAFSVLAGLAAALLAPAAWAQDLDTDALSRHKQPAPAVTQDYEPSPAIWKLADEDTDEKITYQIVGADEADIKAGLLSVSSPLARALIGKTKGDEIEVTVPSGDKFYLVDEVAFV